MTVQERIARAAASRVGLPLETYLGARATGMKYCSFCRSFKLASVECFARKRGAADGLRNECRPCGYRKRMENFRRSPRRLAALRAWEREYRVRNRDKRRAYHAAWLLKHPGYSTARATEWRKRNPGRFHENARNYKAARRARLRGCHGATAIDLNAIYFRNGGLCGICAEPVARDRCDFDHIIPVSRGGLHVDHNLQPAHPACNRRKQARMPTEMLT